MFTLRRREALEQANITHVLSVLRTPLDQALFSPFEHMIVEVDDVDDENLLEHFPATNRFIQQGLDGGGGVLVHWYVHNPVQLSLAYPTFNRYQRLPSLAILPSWMHTHGDQRKQAFFCSTRVLYAFFAHTFLLLFSLTLPCIYIDTHRSLATPSTLVAHANMPTTCSILVPWANHAQLPSSLLI